MFGVKNDQKIINAFDCSDLGYIFDQTKLAHYSHQDEQNHGSLIKIGPFFTE